MSVRRRDCWMLAGLIASVLTAFSSELNLFPPTWHHWMTLGGIVGATVTGYLKRNPWDTEDKG